jgi:hypothetical protein
MAAVRPAGGGSGRRRTRSSDGQQGGRKQTSGRMGSTGRHMEASAAQAWETLWHAVEDDPPATAQHSTAQHSIAGGRGAPSKHGRHGHLHDDGVQKLGRQAPHATAAQHVHVQQYVQTAARNVHARAHASACRRAHSVRAAPGVEAGRRAPTCKR